jgi:anaerobic magnesium-protoporphyrin IX monomethyl ester cyclase
MMDFKPNLLSIVPPYPAIGPPAGAAALLGYLKANGVFDFDFLDLRLTAPKCYAATYTPTGVFGESFVMDIPDLPLVLELLASVDSKPKYVPGKSHLFDSYCFERGISPAYLRSYLGSLNRYIENIFDNIPTIEFIGFSVWTSNYLSTLLAAYHLKRRKEPPFIVAGGPHVSESLCSADLCLKSGLFDTVVLGEGEETLLELYKSFRTKNFKYNGNISGTRLLDPKSGIIHSSERIPTSISKLPLPSFEEMNIDAYQIDDFRAIPYQLSRGCPHKCTFCSEWTLWHHFRQGLPEQGADNVLQLHLKYGVDYIHFTDSLLNANLKTLKVFTEKLKRHNIDITWSGFMRAKMDLETAKLLKQAGCDEVFVGVESFSNESLLLMNKKRSESDNIESLRAFLKAGIFVVAGLVPGFPGDTRKGFMHSVKILRTLQTNFSGQLHVNTEPFRISPGQPLFNKLDKFGLIPIKWDERYLDIAPQYKDITSTVYCSVKGNNQGFERIGRERIAFSIYSGMPVPTDSLVYVEDEEISLDEFTFDHVYGCWCKASIKSNSGHIYTLLVSDLEKEELEEVISEAPKEGIAGRQMDRVLTQIERLHLVSPSRQTPAPVASVFRKSLTDNDILVMSPYIIAREMGWRFNRAILFLNYVNAKVTRRPSVESRLFRFISKEPHTVRQLCRYIKRMGLTSKRNWCIKWFTDMIECGILVIKSS